MRGDGSDLTEVADVGRFDGTQSVAGTRVGQRVSATIVLVGETAYVRGNANGLRDLVGLKAPAAAKEAGKWLLVPASDQQLFGNLAGGLTVSSAVQQLDLVGALKLLPETTLGARAVLGVETATVATGTPGTQVLYMRADGRPLPVEEVQRFQSVEDSISFGHWGEPPQAKVPPAPVPLKRSWLS